MLVVLVCGLSESTSRWPISDMIYAVTSCPLSEWDKVKIWISVLNLWGEKFCDTLAVIEFGPLHDTVLIRYIFISFLV